MHEIKLCPSCSKPFECKAGSITICECSSLLLTMEARERLAKQFDDCLCKDCLEKIEQEKSVEGEY